MFYGIYVTYSKCNQCYTQPSCGWFRDKSFNSLRDAKNSLLHVADMLNEDFWDWHFVNSHTLVATRSDNLPNPSVEHITYHIEKR